MLPRTIERRTTCNQLLRQSPLASYAGVCRLVCDMAAIHWADVVEHEAGKKRKLPLEQGRRIHQLAWNFHEGKKECLIQAADHRGESMDWLTAELTLLPAKKAIVVAATFRSALAMQATVRKLGTATKQSYCRLEFANGSCIIFATYSDMEDKKQKLADARASRNEGLRRQQEELQACDICVVDDWANYWRKWKEEQACTCRFLCGISKHQ